jgi:hypothetical protein
MPWGTLDMLPLQSGRQENGSGESEKWGGENRIMKKRHGEYPSSAEKSCAWNRSRHSRGSDSPSEAGKNDLSGREAAMIRS